MEKVSTEQATALKASTKRDLKRQQPTFKPLRNLDDYTLYREFKKDFLFFITDVDEANFSDKAQWLKICVSGDAHALIKNTTNNETGYKAALAALDAKYLNK